MPDDVRTVTVKIDMPNRPEGEETFVAGLVGSFVNGETHDNVEVVPGYEFADTVYVGVQPDETTDEPAPEVKSESTPILPPEPKPFMSASSPTPPPVVSTEGDANLKTEVN